MYLGRKVFHLAINKPDAYYVSSPPCATCRLARSPTRISDYVTDA